MSRPQTAAWNAHRSMAGSSCPVARSRAADRARRCRCRVGPRGLSDRTSPHTRTPFRTTLTHPRLRNWISLENATLFVDAMRSSTSSTTPTRSRPRHATRTTTTSSHPRGPTMSAPSARATRTSWNGRNNARQSWRPHSSRIVAASHDPARQSGPSTRTTRTFGSHCGVTWSRPPTRCSGAVVDRREASFRWNGRRLVRGPASGSGLVTTSR